MSSSAGRQYWSNSPIKAKAHEIVKRAIKIGGLIRPTECSACPRENVRILAHHTDYSKPLEVDWWCESCHRKFHWCVTRILKLLEKQIMFIICQNDFPHELCPVGTDRELAEKIAKHYQDECGMQIGLACKTHFYVIKVEYVPAELLVYLKQEKDNVN